MDNLVDDYKNWVPGGMRIRQGGWIKLPNSSNPVDSLGVGECVLCYGENLTTNDEVYLYTKESITADYFIFKFPIGGSVETRTYDDYVSIPANYVHINSNNKIRLRVYTHYMVDALYTFPYMRWLVLRIT